MGNKKKIKSSQSKAGQNQSSPQQPGHQSTRRLGDSRGMKESPKTGNRNPSARRQRKSITRLDGAVAGSSTHTTKIIESSALTGGDHSTMTKNGGHQVQLQQQLYKMLNQNEGTTRASIMSPEKKSSLTDGMNGLLVSSIGSMNLGLQCVRQPSFEANQITSPLIKKNLMLESNHQDLRKLQTSTKKSSNYPQLVSDGQLKKSQISTDIQNSSLGRKSNLNQMLFDQSHQSNSKMDRTNSISINSLHASINGGRNHGQTSKNINLSIQSYGQQQPPQSSVHHLMYGAAIQNEQQMKFRMAPGSQSVNQSILSPQKQGSGMKQNSAGVSFSNGYESKNSEDKSLAIQQQMAQMHVANQQIVGINGLLNMTKQRGLLYSQAQQQYQQNQQNSSSMRNQGANQRSQSNNQREVGSISNLSKSSPNHFKNLPGNNIVKQITLGAHPTNYKMVVAGNQNTIGGASTCPISVFEMQFMHIQPNARGPFQKNYQQFAVVPTTQSLMINNSLKQQNRGVGIPPQYVLHQQMNARQKPFTLANAGYMYFESVPVAVNGKQMSNKYQHQDPRMSQSIRKGSSSQNLNNANYAMADQLSSQLLSDYYQQASNEETIRQQQYIDDNNMYQDFTVQQQYEAMINQEYQLYKSALSNQSNTQGPSATGLAPYKKSKIPFSNAYVEDCYKFVVIPGNNSGLIRKALERRDWWIEIPAVHSLYNFKWQPVSYGIKFERLSPMKPKPGEIGQFNTFSQKDSENQGTTEMGIKQMVNHFEFHHLISEKAQLFESMQKYCDAQKENIFDYCPITFYVEVQDLDKPQQYQQNLQQFIQFYQALEENRERIKVINDQVNEFKKQRSENILDQDKQNDSDDGSNQTKDEQPLNSQAKREKEFLNKINNQTAQERGYYPQSNKTTKFRTFNLQKRTQLRQSMPVCHFNGYNLWLLKPTHLNRGRGIHVFRDLDTLHKLIKEYCQGRDEEVKVSKKDRAQTSEGQPDQQPLDDEEESSPEQMRKKVGSPKKNNQNSGAFKIKHNTFIIQKYIEKPLLLCNRKFDIRVWVLLNQDYDVFMFKEGYLRTSSSEYSIDLQNVDNQYVHLTNNAVQKFSEHYGEFEDGNQLSYTRFQEIIDKQWPDCGVSVKEDLVPQMKELIIKSMYSVRKRIDPHRRRHCFEMFGYDFIIDEDFNMWLIEINTNPCIEESSQLLKMLLPRAIEDMLKLTIDQMFPKIKKGKKKGTVQGSPIKNIQRMKTTIGNGLQKIDEEEIDKFNAHNQSSILQGAGEGICGDGERRNSITDEQQRSRIHPVTGYSDKENLWEKIWNLDKSDTPPNKYPNCRSEFNICVSEGSKHFKLKKNPLYKRILKEVKEQMTTSSQASTSGGSSGAEAK